MDRTTISGLVFEILSDDRGVRISKRTAEESPCDEENLERGSPRDAERIQKESPGALDLIIRPNDYVFVGRLFMNLFYGSGKSFD